jgi:DNA adenine methylase
MPHLIDAIERYEAALATPGPELDEAESNLYDALKIAIALAVVDGYPSVLVDPGSPGSEGRIMATARAKLSRPKLRPAVKWPGGKSYLAMEIIAGMPDHAAYVEPFAGGAVVLLNKPRAPVEVLGDLDVDLMEFYRVLRDRPGELIGAMREWARGRRTRADFRAAWERSRAGGSADPVRAACDWLAVRRWSRGGYGKTFGWSDRLRGGLPEYVNSWRTLIDQIPAIASRLRGVDLVCGPALDTIRAHDAPGTLFYCDPPYVPSTRTARGVYGEYEMSVEDHAALLDTLNNCRGMVILSGYRCDLYDAKLRGWHRDDHDMANNAGQGKTKQRRIESVWRNPAAVQGSPGAFPALQR